MPTASESRAALTLVTGAAVGAVTRLLGSLTGSPESRRSDLFDVVPGIIGYYADGTSALAADSYDDAREAASARGSFTAEPVVVDRGRKLYNAIAWAAEPWFDGEGNAEERVAEVVRMETTRPYRDTILTNRRRDPEAVGWRRVTSGDACKFCQMLAAKGAIYREETVRFAAHGKRLNGSGGTCQCTAWPAFRSNDEGVSATVMQYVASQRRRTPAQKAALRDYLNENFPDANG